MFEPSRGFRETVDLPYAWGNSATGRDAELASLLPAYCQLHIESKCIKSTCEEVFSYLIISTCLINA